MKTFITKTGFGVIKDKDGNVIHKIDYPIGEHKIRDEYTFEEYPSREAINAVKAYHPPKSEDEIREDKIRAEMNRLAYSQAEQSLIDKGEIQSKAK